MYLLVFFDPLIVNDSDTFAVKFLFSQKSLENENTETDEESNMEEDEENEEELDED